MNSELLAPAGSYEALREVLLAGADAVYIGGAKFGARAFADNPDEEALLSAIDEVHVYGKKLYLTVNTLLKQKEMNDELYDYLTPCYERGLDAVIVQDYGVLYQIRKWFPDLPVHCSTQMTITGPESAKMLEDLGAKRIVTARELSLGEIRKIRERTKIEIESFVHGALCYSYSGQCLFSSLIGGRSGNRGRCAQPCRLPYKVTENGRLISGEHNAYALNTRDMCTLELLPEIIGAGVTSLKIEGRMKKPGYAAGVVQVYRKYVDLYDHDPENYKVDPVDLKILSDLYNRDGFNQSYYQRRNGQEMMALRNKKNESRKAGVRQNSDRAKVYRSLHDQYHNRRPQKKIKGSFTLFSGSPAILTLYADSHVVTVEKDGVQTAKNQPLTEKRVKKQLTKTGDTPFIFENIDIFMGDQVFVPIQFLNEIKREGIDKLEHEILDSFHRGCSKVSESAESTDFPDHHRVRNTILTASAETQDQVKALKNADEIMTLFLGYQIFPRDEFYTGITKYLDDLTSIGKKVYLSLPHIVRAGDLSYMEPYFEKLITQGLSGFLVRNLESFAILKKHHLESYAILDHNMYTFNLESQKFFENQGLCKDTAPLELNAHELRERFNDESEMVIYGYLPMMVSAQCIMKNYLSCTKSNNMLTLTDRKNKDFMVQCYCDLCYNVIYNSVPLVLLKEAEDIKRLGMHSLRLSFTTESYKETRRMIQSYIDRYLYEKSVLFVDEYTTGHYKRGIE